MRIGRDLVEIALNPIFLLFRFLPFFDISLTFLQGLRTNRFFFSRQFYYGFFSRQPPFLKRLSLNSLDFDVIHFRPSPGSGFFLIGLKMPSATRRRSNGLDSDILCFRCVCRIKKLSPPPCQKKGFLSSRTPNQGFFSANKSGFFPRPPCIS